MQLLNVHDFLITGETVNQANHITSMVEVKKKKKDKWHVLADILYECFVILSSLLLLFQMSQKRFRTAAMLFVFTVSAVVHEYILAICFGFFYPVLFCLFMCFGSKKKKNRPSLTLLPFNNDKTICSFLIGS